MSHNLKQELDLLLDDADFKQTISIMKKLSIPIYFIGLGEKIDDLIPFSFKEYLLALVGKEKIVNVK